MATLSEALSAYRLCAQAEGRSVKTIRWIMSSMHYFSEFLGDKRDIAAIDANDGVISRQITVNSGSAYQAASRTRRTKL